jgi:hypothetical protein
MALEASALLGAVDEAEWERVGIFATVDALCSKDCGVGALTHALNIVDKVPPSSLSNSLRVADSSFQGVGKYTNHFIEGGVSLGSLPEW